jgi:hypothetical protein
MTTTKNRLASFINDNFKGTRVTAVAVGALMIAGIAGFSSLDAHLNGNESPVVTVAQAIASPFHASDTSELVSVSDVSDAKPQVVTVSGSAGINLSDETKTIVTGGESGGLVLPMETVAPNVITVSGSAGINLP